MSGKKANSRRTICEVLREINDLHQGESELDILTRQKLSEAGIMAKSIVRRLMEYKGMEKSELYKEVFPDKNIDYKKDKKIRKKKNYKRGNFEI